MPRAQWVPLDLKDLAASAVDVVSPVPSAKMVLLVLLAAKERLALVDLLAHKDLRDLPARLDPKVAPALVAERAPRAKLVRRDPLERLDPTDLPESLDPPASVALLDPRDLR